MKKHNYKKLQTQDRIISTLLIIIALASWITYKQARTIEAKDNTLEETKAKMFIQNVLAQEYAEKLEVEKARQEALQTAKYGTVSEKIKVLALNDKEAELIRRESSFNHTAKNPESTAYGLAQFLRSTRTKYAKMFGFQPDTDNPFEQVTMMRKYVADRYQTIDKALEFHSLKNYY